MSTSAERLAFTDPPLSMAESREPLHALQNIPCRVLVVDDDALVRARLSALLDVSRYQVHVASSGCEALTVLDTARCDIVLTDWNMPDMDGLSLCRYLRLRDNGPYVYVLMFTIRGTARDELAGLAAGADGYIVKGATVHEILAKVEIGRRITHAKRAGTAINDSHNAGAAPYVLPGAEDLNYLAAHLPRELARAQRYARSLSLLNCRIETPPKRGDGRDAERQLDRARTFLLRVSASIRKADWIAQTGVDSFVLVLPETNVNGARVVAKKVHHAIAAASSANCRKYDRLRVDIELIGMEPHVDADCTQRVNALLRAAAQADRQTAAQSMHDLPRAAGVNQAHEIH